MSDTEILDFLQEVVVDTIYMDSGEIIDVRGLDVREAIIKAMKRNRCDCGSLITEEDQKDCDNCQSQAGKKENAEPFIAPFRDLGFENSKVTRIY
ncbi:MAG: hypothetical protein U0Y68_04755 [Blastocatellia bacterium]